jgi:hypothetical protein
MIDFDPASHTYKVDGWPYASVTQIIADAGLYGDAARYFTEYAAERGSFVHKAIELYLAGTLDESTVDPAIQGYLDAFVKFIGDTNFYPTHSEQVFYSVTLRVAGRPDLIGPLNNHAAIIDIKTSITPSPVTGIQLAGYEYLYGTLGKRFALHLKDDGKYRLHEYTDRNDRAVFLAAVTLNHWKQENMKERG